MRATSVKLPESLDRRLTELSRRRKISRSALLREALEAFGDRRGQSVSALASDLAGSLVGPRDLSTSPKHMVGYGK
jgi:predicted transcriptional regulator